jgi:hypothetical protein
MIEVEMTDPTKPAVAWTRLIAVALIAARADLNVLLAPLTAPSRDRRRADEPLV